MADPGSCPKCDCADKIRKVSAIFREGTQVSGLAEDLKPPIKPRSTPQNGWGIAFIIGLTPILCLGIVISAAIQGRSAAGRPITGTDIFQFAVFAIIGLGIVGIAYWGRSREKKRIQETLPRWENAIRKWNQLYYCERDDILFNPDDSPVKAIPVSGMNPYIYS